MIYKIRPGIIMLKVCDAHLLVAERRLWDAFPSVRSVSKKQVVIWKLMEKGYNSDETLTTMSKLFQKPVEEVHQKFEPIIDSLAGKGYIIPVEEDIE